MTSHSSPEGIISDYRADTVGIINALLSGYSGGITIVREMAQNVDDVPGDDERWLEFHFNPDALVIKNNTVFRDIDFQNITNIARGGKKLEQRNTIGAFGVGFVSVYQLTDRPSIHSNGRHIEFLPDHSQVITYDSTVYHHTEFHLPYRRFPTETGQQLGMPPVTDVALRDIQEALIDEAYRLLFFLRRLHRITMYHNGTLICAVDRHIVPASAPGQPDLLTLTRIQQHEREQHHWLRYSGAVHTAAPLRSDGSAEKDTLVQIVIPDADVPDHVWRERVPGRLYNYLPTDIRTELPFQINGDFYPSTDRKHIDLDHTNHRDWNLLVLKAIGDCLATALESLRQQFSDAPLKLYQRLPINKTGSDLVKPISEAFFAAAVTLTLFYTNQQWRDASRIRWAKDELHRIAKHIDLRLMDRELQSAAWGLIQRAGVVEYTLEDFLRRVSGDIRRGSLLIDGPTYLQTHEHLSAIYTMLEKDFARDYQHLIATTPVFVDHADRLWGAKECVRTERPELREALSESGLHFWQGQEEEYPRLSTFVEKFKLEHLWRLLREQLSRPVTLSDAPPWLNSRSKLATLYKTIRDTQQQVSSNDVQSICLCLDRNEILCRPSAVFMPVSEPMLYDLFAEDLLAPLVHREIWNNKQHRSLYEHCGVDQFGWEQVLKRLEQIARTEVLVHEAHPALNSREKLLRLYRFLRNHQGEFQPKHRELLRHRLAIWLCRDGLVHTGDGLSLPASNSAWPESIATDLMLDVKTTDGFDPFFKEVLEVKQLDTARFITQYVLPQYADLTQTAQLQILIFLRHPEQIEILRTNRDMFQQVRLTPLIYGTDNQLHRAHELCFPRTQLPELFPDTFSLPHAMYAIPKDGLEGWAWGPFFSLLGIHRVAPADVVLQQVQQLTGPGKLPRHNREAVEKVFRYLEEHWNPHYVGKLSRLAEMRWLPARGDNERWYRAADLYHRTEVGLVGLVAPILGFNDATRPRAEIADPLGFPRTPERALVVKQLLALQAANQPATDELYRYLTNATEAELKPLHNTPSIWDAQQQRYWRANHIFLTNQHQEFGSYRGYLPGGEHQRLLRNLGAQSRPSDADYCELIIQIAEQWRGVPLPPGEEQLLVNAYSRLADAPDTLLAPLRKVPCVASQAGAEAPVLCLPSHAVMQPQDRFTELFPTVPIARYMPAGEETLRRLGVRSLDDVMHVEFRLLPTRQHPLLWLQQISRLEGAIIRLFHHYHQRQETAARMEELTAIAAYEERAIQVVYHIELSNQRLSSPAVNEQFHYQRDERRLYILATANQGQSRKALAHALHQILALPNLLPILLQELLENPRDWRTILDENHIRPLPPQLDLQFNEAPIETIQLGERSDELLAGLIDERPGIPGPAIDLPTRQPDSLGGDGTRREYTTPSTMSLGTPTSEPARLKNTEGRSTEAGSMAASNRKVDPLSPGESIRPRQGTSPLQTPTTSTRLEPPDTHSRMPGRLEPNTIPAFHGRSALSSPAISTDLDGLRDRARAYALAHNIPLDQPAAPLLPAPARRNVAPPTEPQEADVAQFILSFAEVAQGFLRLHKKARALFPHQPERVHCSTGLGEAFELYFNWQRETPIVYNQNALAGFFAQQHIPAGGIVYLERLHGDDYRLYYNHAPHTVREVRIAVSEHGVVTYETIAEVDVECETDDAIYRAEKRHEDQVALWLEAVGKKSVEETLCDLLLAAPEGWLHEADLIAMVNAERMVAAGTVRQKLNQRRWFISDANGFWRLDVPALLAESDDLIPHWVTLTHTLLTRNDTALQNALNALLPLLQQLRQRLLPLEGYQTSEQIGHAADEEDLVGLINANPDNRLAAKAFEEAVRRRIAANDVDLLTDPHLRGWLGRASREVWQLSLRPLLRQEFDVLRRADQYERAAELVQCWNDFDSMHGQNIGDVVREAEAWNSLGTEPPLDVLLQAIDKAPNLIKLRDRLHRTVQSALHRYPATHWLSTASAEQAVHEFLAHVRSCEHARGRLTRDAQDAFDTTIHTSAKQLSEQITELGARVMLALGLSTMSKKSLGEHHLQDLSTYVKQSGKHTIDDFLIALKAWSLCASRAYLHKDIANALAQCHNNQRIWELANNQPWKTALSEAQALELRQSWQQHSADHLQREQAFLVRLKDYEEQPSPLGSLLVPELMTLRARVERDIQNIIGGSAA